MSAKDLTRYLIRRIFSLCCCVFYVAGLFAQEYNYTHYTTSDGLAGETLYTMVQDADGFMWFATETGLSRFDGHKFSNFTVADGLPSNEVFGFYEDEQKRLWVTSFSNEPCYFYKGKIHNKNNTPVLGGLVMPAYIRKISETRQGEIIIIDEAGTVAVLGKSGAIRKYAKGKFTIRLADVLHGIFETGNLQFPAPVKAILDKYTINKKELKAVLITDSSAFIEVGKGSLQHTWLWYTRYDPPKLMVRPERLHVVPLNKDNLLESYRSGGAGIFNLKREKQLARFLPESIVNGVCKDRDGNIWLGTKWNGVYKLSNKEILSFTFNINHTSPAIQFVQAIKDTVFAGNDNGTFWSIVTPVKQQHAEASYKKEKLYKNIDWLQRNASERCIIYNGADFLHLNYKGNSHGIKSLFLYGDTVLVAAFDRVFLSKVNNLSIKVLVKIHEGRATCAARYHGYYYVGTLQGLYIYNKAGRLVAKPLHNRISNFVPGKGNEIWISTYDNGIYALRDHKIATCINTKNSLLSSDLVRCIFYRNNNIWAGTDKGINKISLADSSFLVSSVYNRNNGLNSDIINTIFVDTGMVYAGTAAGLNIFSSGLKIPDTAFNLVFTQIATEDSTVDPDQPLRLPHNHNSVVFYFSGISFSTNNIYYKYRLRGLNDQWQKTTEQALRFIALPSGKYTLQVQAITPNGNKSVIIEKAFDVQQSVLEYWWVRLLLALLTMTISGAIVYLWISQIRKTEAAKRETYQRMAELEQMALRAQMNPHFIFNCLNSVQNYILKQDAGGANLYLSQFAGLVRQTLENSSKLRITLREELTYLRHYIELERLQGNFPFNYEIHIDAGIVTSAILVPNMIIQPFIENALKHGLKKKEANGHLTIKILKKDSMLIWTITDNGPGINHMAKIKEEYQSRGISLIRKRIDTLNLMKPEMPGITFTIDDLQESGSQGTRVVIAIPIIVNEPVTK